MPSKSKSQQKFMGMVHGVQKGTVDPKDVSKKVKDVAKKINPKDAKDFASTKHTGLPKQVEITMDEQFEELVNEGNNKIKAKILEKLKLEGGIPANWLGGRLSNVHTSSRTRKRAEDMEDTNFDTANSGQPDLEEHHEDFPQEILDQTVGEFLDVLKGKSEEHYNHVEDMIEKFFMNSDTESVNEDTGKQDADGIYNKYVKGEKKIPSAMKIAHDIRMDDGKISAGYIQKILKQYKNLSIPMKESINLNESAMGDIAAMAQESKTFKEFIKDVFRDYKDLKKSKESVSWLKSIYDNEIVESSDVSESGKFHMGNFAGTLIPSSHRQNSSLKKDLMSAINSIYKKHKIDLSFVESMDEDKKDFSYDYADIGQFATPEKDWKKYTDKQFEKLGKRIVQLKFKGDVEKAYNTIVRGMKESVNEDGNESQQTAVAFEKLHNAFNSVLHSTYINDAEFKILKKLDDVSWKLGNKSIKRIMNENVNEAHPSFNPNFVPNVGSIDTWKLKGLLKKNQKFITNLSPDEKKFFMKPDVMVVGHSFTNIFTDGKMEFEYDMKSNTVTKPLQKARRAIVNHWKEMNESINEVEHEKGSVLWLKIGNERGYGNWFFKKIDSTHFEMANSEKVLGTRAAIVHHVGQHRDETYYKDLVAWLHGKIASPKLNGKKYKGLY